MIVENLWVVVPAYNEQNIIHGLLNQLVHLHTTSKVPFNVVICDNNSTDDTVSIVKTFIETHQLDWHVINEPMKGTGVAADTAIRYAISQGASHVARTDADCLPESDWLNNIVELFDQGLRMVAGRIITRLDDVKVPKWKAKFFDDFVVPVAAWFGTVRPLNRGEEFHGPYVMTAGCNMAIEAVLYEECGGFPRTKIEDVHEDHMLVNQVRRVTDKYGYYKNVVVKVSARRIAKWGVVNTLRWYANHSYCPENVDIR